MYLCKEHKGNFWFKCIEQQIQCAPILPIKLDSLEDYMNALSHACAHAHTHCMGEFFGSTCLI